jgi:putative restriction endonuclease
MRGYVAVTDNEWYRFLAARPEISVVNFWRPGGGTNFRALAEDEFYFFKARAPINRIVGGGRYSGFATMRVSAAWKMFGEANGVASLAQLRERIGLRRGTPIAPDEDPDIGCVLVHDVIFFPEDSVLQLPPGWAPSGIQQGKLYDMYGQEAGDYFADLMRLIPDDASEIGFGEPWQDDDPVFGESRLTPYRLRQHAFQAVVSTAYHGRCAITGSKIRPALHAAHILPVTNGGKNRLDNGLLLRSDVHAMFDGGYLGVDPRYRLQVSPRLREEFGNGDQFYAQAGQAIAVPERRIERPRRDFLEWHLDEVFKMS